MTASPAPPPGNPAPKRASDQAPVGASSLRQRVFDIVFESDTPAGKFFDVVLILLILASVAVVMLESVEEYRLRYGTLFRNIEYVFTGLFTIEYALRLWSVRRTRAYALSFFGIVDLLSILPTYLAGLNQLAIVRALRILRVFRVLKLGHHLEEIEELMRALRSSVRKITVFIFTVLILVTICGALMYLIEGPKHGFTSIPRAVYWAIVTMTTVGYGDISPATPAGQLFASFIMIMGYGIIAVPTGIVTAEMANVRGVSGQTCSNCGLEGHHVKAAYCRRCGTGLHDGA